MLCAALQVGARESVQWREHEWNGVKLYPGQVAIVMKFYPEEEVEGEQREVRPYHAPYCNMH